MLSAPNINEPILGGQAQISGNFTVQSANQLAVSLASGKLPVKLNVIEERTVSAGARQGFDREGRHRQRSSRPLAVIVFMLITYGRFGVYANIALIVNALLILGIMAVFNATLTLPGIAGFVLTIGAAVDANVLINERIREEQRRGRKVLDAIETGYKEASTRDLRRQHHQRHRGGADVLLRLGPDPRLRGRADDRHRHLGVHGRQFHAHAGRAVGAPQAARANCISEAWTMKLLKLVPDNTNLDFMSWRNIALVLSIIATVASLVWSHVNAASTSASTSSAAR